MREYGKSFHPDWDDFANNEMENKRINDNLVPKDGDINNNHNLERERTPPIIEDKLTKVGRPNFKLKEFGARMMPQRSRSRVYRTRSRSGRWSEEKKLDSMKKEVERLIKKVNYIEAGKEWSSTAKYEADPLHD